MKRNGRRRNRRKRKERKLRAKKNTDLGDDNERNVGEGKRGREKNKESDVEKARKRCERSIGDSREKMDIKEEVKRY